MKFGGDPKIDDQKGQTWTPGTKGLRHLVFKVSLNLFVNLKRISGFFSRENQ